MHVGNNESCFIYRDPASAQLGKCPDITEICVPCIKIVFDAYNYTAKTARDIDKKRITQALNLYDFDCAAAVIHKINGGRKFEVLVNLTFHCTEDLKIDEKFAEKEMKRLLDYLQDVFPDIPMRESWHYTRLGRSLAKMVFGEQLYDLRCRKSSGRHESIVDFGNTIFYAKDNKIKSGTITKMWSANDRICIEVQDGDNVDIIFYDDGVVNW